MRTQVFTKVGTVYMFPQIYERGRKRANERPCLVVLSSGSRARLDGVPSKRKKGSPSQPKLKALRPTSRPL